MKSYYNQLTNLLIRLAIILFVYTLSRAFFLMVNYQTFGNNTFADLFKIFFFGIRFDFTAVIMLNLWFLILYLLPFNFANNKIYIRIVGYFFYTWNFLLLLVNFADAEYFKFIGKRSTADIFGYLFMSSDIERLMPQFFSDYWYIGLTWVACFAGAVFAGVKLTAKKPEVRTFSIKQWINVSLMFILVTGLLFLGARGTGLKPVRIISAARYTATQNIPLLLNSPFCILHTLGNEVLKPISFFDEKKLEKLYSPEQAYTSKTMKHDNVVIIIMESFSKEFVGALNNGKGYTPFFDNIIHQGLVFDNTFANGKRSIEAVPAALAGLPALTDESYISSRFSGNHLEALPFLLVQKGYQTSFFHGGHNGTMGFDEFSKVAGMKEYVGFNEYKGPEANDGSWGINDEYFLQFFANKLNAYKTPFFSTVFTLSSHHPYKLPAAYKDSFSEAPNPLLKSIRYADMSLRKFFKTASTMSWYKHTLFILMADHTTTQQSFSYGTAAGMYRIPMVFFHPGDTSVHGINHRVAQQADIMPSVIDYLGLNTPFLAFGNSVFDAKAPGWSVSYLGGIYHLFQNNYLLTFDGEKPIGLFNFKTDKRLDHNLVNDSIKTLLPMQDHLKAIIQQYNTRLLKNKLVHSEID